VISRAITVALCRTAEHVYQIGYRFLAGVIMAADLGYKIRGFPAPPTGRGG